MSAWLTRIVPDPRDRAVRRDLSDASELHRTLMRLVPDGLGPAARSSAGMLFRVETVRQGSRVLVQTAVAPETSNLPQGYGSVRSKDIAAVLDTLASGLAVRYRIAANPSKRLPRGWAGESGRPGEVVPLRGAAADDWWAGRAADHGLELRSLLSRPLPDARGGGARRIRHAVTQFDGIAVVKEPEAVREAVLNGIGRGKSYGCGLLSLALAEGSA